MGYLSLKKVLCLVVLSGIFSCTKRQKTEPNLNGIWNTIGYGKQFVVTDSKATIYDIYTDGCALNIQLTRNAFEDRFNLTRLTNDSLMIRYGITDYNFIRKKSEAEVCRDDYKTNDPLINFDALWNTFNEHYVSFKLREIDWQKSREKFRTRLNAHSSDLELFQVLKEMTSELKDEHVKIRTPEVLENEIIMNDSYPSELRASVINAINDKYIDSLKTYNKGIVNWGTINNTIGYIQINAFEDLANYNIDQELSNNAFWEKYWEKAEERNTYRNDNLTGILGVMSQIVQDLKHLKSCIIDVRFNGGGFDETGLAVLSYLTDKKRMVFSKKARVGDGFTKPQNIFIEPNGKRYLGNVYLLTSFQTASAAEVFVMAAQNLPNVKTIGSNTEGIFSDILGKKLPNGWEYGLSNEIYLSADGINYEKQGLPSDFDLKYKRNPEEFYNNLFIEIKTGDHAIEKVMELSQE